LRDPKLQKKKLLYTGKEVEEMVGKKRQTKRKTLSKLSFYGCLGGGV